MSNSTLRKFIFRSIAMFTLVLSAVTVFAQVTTSAIAGFVTDTKGEALIGVTVSAVHVPSGTRYGGITNVSGNYRILGVRVGGPYSITVSYTGFESQTKEITNAALGATADLDFKMNETGVVIDEVLITANRRDNFSSERTGASTTFSKDVLKNLPITGARTITDITKYSAFGNGSSFGAQDSRLNNFTVDGSVFNNGFGLGDAAQAGGRTGSTAISLDAIEEVQVNLAPFDVRQTGFTGSGINAVTRSGTNEFSGSVYGFYRNNDTTLFNGTKANGQKVSVGEFNELTTGIRLGGPIIKNKLFFFVNAEIQRKTEPATSWVADGSSNAGQKTRVKKQDLEDLSAFLKSKYGYETGAYENFDNETNSDKFLVRVDYNVNDKNKLTLRYTHHNSLADVMISNSSSLGNGSRRTNIDAMAFQNSGYLIGDNTRSIVAELNSNIGERFFNTFSAGYDFQDEDRKYKGDLFPTIDILEGGKTYISIGFDPFTPNNKLNYGTLHLTDNLSIYSGKHTYTVGANYDYYKSSNLFFPGSNGVYVLDSLADFYSAANSTADTSPVKLKFQYRYSALDGNAEPLQVLELNKIDLYGQDDYQISRRFRLIYGVRGSAITFKNTGLSNTKVDGQSYVDDNEVRGYTLQTGKLPKTKVLWEPRIGFNWDVDGTKQTQLRGGTGIFTGRPPYVWVSNTIGNNGVLTGFIDQSNTTKYKFTPDANTFTPETPTLPSTFDIAATDPNYRFPQVWKTSFAVDQRLPAGLVFTAEVLYNRNLNAVKYFDANLEPATARFAGPDNRSRFPGSGLSSSAVNAAVRINDNVSRAAVMSTTNEGYYWGVTFQLEMPERKGFYGKFAYTTSQAQDLMSAGSIASGSWTGVRTVNGNNNLALSFADQDIPNRMFGILSYALDYGKRIGGRTTFSIGYDGFEGSRWSYAIAGDMNGDGVRDNDLLFVPNKGSDLAFKELKITYKDANGASVDKIFTPADQAAAFDIFVEQDDYLKTRRGQYAERNGAILPWLHRFNLSVAQDFFVMVGGKRNAIQVRADILNVGNMLNDSWGVGKRFGTPLPLSFASVTSAGVPEYRMASTTVGGVPQLISKTLSSSAGLNDIWRLQLGVRYTFN